MCSSGCSAARSGYSERYSSSSVSNGSIPATNQWSGSLTSTRYGWIGGWATNWLPSVSAHSGKTRGASTPSGVAEVEGGVRAVQCDPAPAGLDPVPDAPLGALADGRTSHV